MLTLISLLLLAVSSLSAEAARTSDPFYVIAHMANSQASLDWAVREGANGVELDLKFDEDANPTVFEHGGVCDCSCPHPSAHHICEGALNNKCSGSDASNEATQHLRHLAGLPGIALVNIDSKVNEKWGKRLRTAGEKVVALVEDNLFAKGYRGHVLIAVPSIKSFEFLHAAALAASSKPNRARYYFTFDDEKNNYSDVAAMLSRIAANRVFGAGITSCWVGDFTQGLRQAVSGVRNRQVGMSYIWTLDKESSFESHIELGVQGILTNRPRLLKSMALAKGLRLATPSDVIPSSSAVVESPNKCDCDYKKGGCTISFPAPLGKACKCSMKFAWTCGGSVVDCNNRSHGKCSTPDATVEACRLGGGDCDGYNN